MTLQNDYSEDLVQQFYSTVYFHPDEARSMTFMCGNQPRTTTLAQFRALWVMRWCLRTPRVTGGFMRRTTHT
jgi:hypothetical protein